MAYTYSKLASSTVGVGGAATIAFNNIPQNYTDLVLKVSTRNVSSGIGSFRMGFNGSTAANYNYRQIQGAGSGTPTSSAGTSAASTANEVGLNDGNTSTASTFSNNEIYIPNYAGSTNKSWSADGVEEENATAAYSRLTAGLWSNVTAITSIIFTPDAGTFAQYSTATLYGIRVEL
jgi:hypothetical protein